MTIARHLATSLYLCSCLMLPTAAMAADGHWRWTDSEGEQHYSDRPPAGIEAEFIEFATGRGKKSSPAATPAAPSSPTVPGKGETAKNNDMEILPEPDPEICAQAKGNLQALNGKPRVRITEADGSIRMLTEEEKEEQRENARKFVKLYCPQGE